MPKKKKELFKLDSKRKPFERQPGETDMPWSAFVIYRDEGTFRTLKKAAEKYKKLHNLKQSHETLHFKLQHWSSKYLWVSRSAEWDNELDKVRRRRKIHEVEEMRERHLGLAKSLQGLGAIELKKWLNKVQDSEDVKTVQLSTTDVRALIELGVRLERLNRDEPESVNKTEQEISTSNKRKHLRKFLEDESIAEEVHALAQKIPWEKNE